MGVFSIDKRKITCVYTSKSDTDVQTLGYLKASKKDLLTLDITKETLTGTQWVELSEKLGKPLKSLIDNDAIENDIENFDKNDCITILRENPKALNGAIIFSGDKALQTKSPSDALKFIDDDSAVIEKPYKKHKME